MYGYETFHEDLMQSLIGTVRQGESSHAYIFEGDGGLSVLESARLFAAALTCKNNDTSPCGSCRSCIEAHADTNPDIIYIRPEKDRKSIGTKVMRDIEGDASVKPFDAVRKVYIIENASLLTEAAQNVFLKTLEEPPEYVVFILVTENAETLLQTIRSRAVTVHFPRVSDSAVREYISENYPEENQRLEFLVKYCAGIPKTADSVISDGNFEKLRSESLGMLPALLSHNRAKAFDVVKFADENKESFDSAAEFWISFLRDVLLIQTGAAENLINIDKKDVLRNIASRAEPETVARMSDRLVRTKKMTARYVNVKAVSLWLALK